MQVALLGASAPAGNALGQQLAEKLAFFLDRGADVGVFLDSTERLHSALKPYLRDTGTPHPEDDGWQFLSSSDLVIADYSQHYRQLNWLPLLANGKTRILLDYHGVTPPELWPEHREVLEKAQRRRGLSWCADGVLVHSRFGRRELLDDTGFPASWTHPLGYPVDTDWFRPGPPGGLLERLGLRAQPLLLFVGRTAPNKRLPVLIEALAHLGERGLPAHALIIGDTSDRYQAEIERCRHWAEQLGVADRLHIPGQVDDSLLREAYRAADVLVMPSLHEGFCLPVLEAMACGLPVIAARAAALPETIGSAGLTFAPGDAADLARQVHRVLNDKVTRWQGDKVTAGITSPCHLVTLSPCHEARRPLRVAVVSGRYGTGFAGGAETSLRTIAESLHRGGHHVEVFTTCALAEDDQSDRLSAGTVEIGGLAVRRFCLNRRDVELFRLTSEAIRQQDGQAPAELEERFFANSLNSAELLAELQRRRDEFDAVITGPYPLGLAQAVARELPEKTLLLPCFHDERFARLQSVREACDRAAAILYHSAEEQKLAEAELSVNHPGSACVGTWINTEARGDSERGRQIVGGDRRYLLYCGRYCAEKNLPLLFDFARRYDAEHPDRFQFVFLGQGSLSIPAEPWARDLGFVDESTRRDVLAGASALVQFSRNESLSLVALEAFAQGVPVLADSGCAVLAGHLEQSRAGRGVAGYDGFAETLDDLWEYPQLWQEMGEDGRDYVRRRYGSHEQFTDALVSAIRETKRPLAERLRQRGLARAAEFGRDAWRERFGRIVEETIDAPPRTVREEAEVLPHCPGRIVAPKQGTTLVPVRLTNRGSHAVLAEGPARGVIRCRVLDEWGKPMERTEADTPLPGMLIPGRPLSAAVTVPVPREAGAYTVTFEVSRSGEPSRTGPPALIEAIRNSGESGTGPARLAGPTEAGDMQLIVEDGSTTADGCAPILESVQAVLVSANRLQRLPDDYLDVTEGWFAQAKRWLKKKLLNNFRRAYVDVLSRQQSVFNRQVLTALNELSECCAALNHAQTRRAESGEDTAESADRPSELRIALSALRSSLEGLEGRVRELEERGREVSCEDVTPSGYALSEPRTQSELCPQAKGQ